MGVWFPAGWEVCRWWWTELLFKQRFPIDWPSGSESVRRMCSVRIMWHQSFCFNHNTCCSCKPHDGGPPDTAAPQTKTPPPPPPPPPRRVGPFATGKTFIKNAGVNISNNSQSPSLSTSARNLEAKWNGRVSLSKWCAGSHRERGDEGEVAARPLI